MRFPVFVLVLLGELGACTPVEPKAPTETLATAPLASPEPSATGGALASPDAGPAAISPNPEPPAPSLPFEFFRVRSDPVLSLGLGKPPKLAVLAAGEVSIFERGAWQSVAVEETRDSELIVEIYFGRDDAPRLMGYFAQSGAPKAFYRRFKDGRFRPEPSELGPLASPNGALYGVLGHDDPEVVCRPETFCLIKRVSGWSRAPAHDEPLRVLLSGGDAWALARDRVERLADGAWTPLAPARTFDNPASVARGSDGSLWIAERGGDALHRLRGGSWETTPSPIRGPRAFATSSGSELWLAGEGGAARFDGNTWARVPGVEGSLHLAAVHGGDLWLAGAAGLFRGVPRK